MSKSSSTLYAGGHSGGFLSTPVDRILTNLHCYSGSFLLSSIPKSCTPHSLLRRSSMIMSSSLALGSCHDTITPLARPAGYHDELRSKTLESSTIFPISPRVSLINTTSHLFPCHRTTHSFTSYRPMHPTSCLYFVM